MRASAWLVRRLIATSNKPPDTMPTRTRAASALLTVLLLLAGCAEQPADTTDDTTADRSDQGLGIGAAQSVQAYDATASRLDSALQANDAISVVAQIDHAANAQQTELSLPAMRVTLFGNPQLGTPLMQANPQAGIDLPQKMLVYGATPTEALVFYNDPVYLAQRHSLADVGTIDTMTTALQRFAQQVAGTAPSVLGAAEVEAGAGLAVMESSRSVDDAYRQIRSAIEGTDALSIVAELDHAANAARVGMELAPTRLIVFGNPQLGTPLMQSEPTAALDLPQKMLVYQDSAGTTQIAYNEPSFLARRHGLTGHDATLQQMSDALQSLAEAGQ